MVDAKALDDASLLERFLAKANASGEYHLTGDWRRGNKAYFVLASLGKEIVRRTWLHETFLSHLADESIGVRFEVAVYGLYIAEERALEALDGIAENNKNAIGISARFTTECWRSGEMRRQCGDPD